MSALIFHTQHRKGNGNMFATPNEADEMHLDAVLPKRWQGTRVDDLLFFSVGM